MDLKTGIIQLQNLSDEPDYWELTVRKSYSAVFPTSFAVDIAAGTNVNITIDWGDGSAPVNYTSTGIKPHSFREPGDYSVKISGSITGGNLQLNDNYSGWGTAEVIETGVVGGIRGLASFANTFNYCQKLGVANNNPIPDGMFDFYPNITSFGACFAGCFSLRNVPIGLFRYNTACTDFASVFLDCYLLKQHQQIFCLAGEESTRFSGKTVTFAGAFKRYTYNPLYALGGTAPALWDSELYSSGSLSGADCFLNHDIESLTNYASIPAEWGGESSPS